MIGCPISLSGFACPPRRDRMILDTRQASRQRGWLDGFSGNGVPLVQIKFNVALLARGEISANKKFTVTISGLCTAQLVSYKSIKINRAISMLVLFFIKLYVQPLHINSIFFKTLFPFKCYSILKK